MRAVVGGVPPPEVWPWELVGVGSPAVKSTELLSVSPAVRDTEVVLLGAGAGEVSRTGAVPWPTRSAMPVFAAQSAAVRQMRASVLRTSATVPEVAAIAMPPVASGAAGRATVPPDPVDSAAAPSRDVVIGEVYGGGGNSGATLTSDFIELATATTASAKTRSTPPAASPCASPANSATSASDEPTPEPTSCSSSTTSTYAPSTPPPENSSANSPSTTPATTNPEATHPKHDNGLNPQTWVQAIPMS